MTHQPVVERSGRSRASCARVCGQAALPRRIGPTGHRTRYDEADACCNPIAAIDGNRVVDLSNLSTVQGLFGTPSGAVRLTWDAENRLVGYEPVQPAGGDAKVAFTYDDLGRRVEKKV